MATTYQYGVNSDPGTTAVNAFIGKLNIDPILFPTGFTGAYSITTNAIQVNSTTTLNNTQLDTIQNLFAINIDGQSVLDVLPIAVSEGPRLAITTGLSGPTGNYDSNSAFYPGAVLVNGNNNIYMCAANTANSAVWKNIGVPRVISACSQGPQGTQTVTSNNNQIIYRVPYGGSIRDGPITSASVISRIVTVTAGATYSIRLQTSGLATIGTTATLTTNAWQTNAIQITNPAAIPTTSDILAFVVTLTVSNVRTQYAEIVLGV